MYVNQSKTIKEYPYPELVACVRYGTIFYYNMNTIIPFIRQDLNDPTFHKINKIYLKRIINDYEESKKPAYLGYSSGRVPTIGYNSDYLMNTYSFLQNQEGVASASIYQHYIHAAMINNPIGMINKILKEFKSYYTRGIFFQTEFTPLITWKMSLDTIKTWPDVITNNKVYSTYVQQLESAIDSGYIEHNRFSSIFSPIYTIMNSMFLPLIIISLITILYDVHRKSSSHTFSFGILLLLIIMYHALITLTISIGASTSYLRYVFDMLPASLLVFASSFIYLSFFFIVNIYTRRARLNT